MLIQLAFLIVCMALGASGGCVAALWRVGYWRPIAPADPPVPDSTNVEQAKESLRQLEDITSRVSDQVAEHSRRVDDMQRNLAEASSEELSTGQPALVAAESLRQANAELQAELWRARRALEEQSEQLKSQHREARTDGLTQLLNRRAFDEEIALLPERLRLTDADATLFLLDIDYFKKFNDTYGHQLGDRVLQHVAGVLSKTVMGMDVVAARYGGEEFALIFAGSLPMAVQLAEDLRIAVESAAILHEGKNLQVTLSVGLCHTDNGIYLDDTLARADEALYAAKGAGRNRAYFHNGAKSIPVTELLMQTIESSDDLSAHQDADEAAPIPRQPGAAMEQSADERRRYPRRSYNRQHPIAPLVNGKIPTPDMFFIASFFDISTGGFGMMLPSPPAAKFYMVALNKGDETLFLTAEVVRMRRSNQVNGDGKRLWSVGCRFVGKLAPQSGLELRDTEAIMAEA